MPDITAAASLDYTGGALRTTRMVPVRLRYYAGNVTSSKDTPLTTAADIPQLDRIQRFDQLTENDMATVRLQLIWQQTMEAIEGAFVAVNARVDEVAIFARISAAEQLAQAANDNAVAAQASVATVQVAVQETFTTIDPVYGTEFTDRLEP